jgi:hypothetical protein
MRTWTLYYSALILRLSEFVKNPVIVLYFLAIVVVVGSFGIWYNLFNYPKHFTCFLVEATTISNLSVYSISILTGAMANFMLDRRERGRGLKIFAFSLFIFGLLSSTVSLTTSGWLLAYAGVFFTYLLWILVYVDDNVIGNNIPNVNPNDPVGGDNPAGVDLPGNVDGYNV